MNSYMILNDIFINLQHVSYIRKNYVHFEGVSYFQVLVGFVNQSEEQRITFESEKERDENFEQLRAKCAVI